MQCHSCHQKTNSFPMDARPKTGTVRRELQELGNRLYLPGQVAGHKVQFLVDTGLYVSPLAAKVWIALVPPDKETH